jgi:hypothetical protein
MKAAAACITVPSVISPEIFRRAQDHRDHRGDDEVAVRHEHRAHVLPGHLRPGDDHLAEQLVEAGALLLLAAEDRDAFAVFAHAGQRARNSASVWFFVSAVGTKLRAITIISPLMTTQ